MRRMKGDDGVVAVLVAILALVLIGLSALVIDAGAFYQERRELQNGADAGALAIAAQCAGGACGSFDADAKLYADDNADAVDEVSGVGAVCGRPAPLPACAVVPDGVGARKYVRVETLTERTASEGGGDKVPWLFGQLLSDEDDGTTVGAGATVVWGAPGGLTSAIPVTMSECEWKRFTSSGSALAPPPDYDAHPGLGYSTSWLTGNGPSFEHVFFTHNTSGNPMSVTTSCPATPPGGDAAGSFGWLSDTDSECSVTTTISPDGDPGFENKPGNSVPSECKKGDFPLPGELVFIPVYDYFTVKGTVTAKGGGQNVWYHLEGYAAFYVTGYNVQLPGGDDKKSIVTGKLPCKGEDRCISGFFTSGLAPATGPVGGGPSFGANTTQLVG